jgi:hypothetical protein
LARRPAPSHSPFPTRVFLGRSVGGALFMCCSGLLSKRARYCVVFLQVFVSRRGDMLIISMDYRCEDGRFLVYARCVTISNPGSLPNSETRDNSGIRSWRKHLSEWARCHKATGGIYFTKKWRAETLQRGLEFENFKLRLKSGIIKCISWLNDLFFGGYDRGFLKEDVKAYLMAGMSPLNSPTFFLLLSFTSIVYGQS